MKGRRRLISHTIAPLRGFVIFCAIFLLLTRDTIAHPYRQQICSNRLESALEQVRRRSAQVKTSRSLQTPYDIYYSLYGQNNEQDDEANGQFHDPGNYMYNRGGFNRRGYYAKNIQQNRRISKNEDFLEDLARSPHKLAVTRVDVEDLKVRVPTKAAARWVEVDKCRFSTQNATLDTRLIFPDLTLSGRVILQPTGGKCNMILRLRHAGIEFHTTPIGFDIAHNEESRRSAPATVRTDSHFAEPGFISVFAHGCQGPSGIRVRHNSKRRFGFAGGDAAQPEVELSEPQIVLGSSTRPSGDKRWGKLHDPFHPNYDIRSGMKYAQRGESVRAPNLDWNNYEAGLRHFSDDFRPGEDNFYRRQDRRFKRETREMFSKNDEVNFDDDILNLSDDNLQEIVETNARSFADVLNGDEALGDALTGELEKVFSMGVRGLLTTYMQRALQPAIKETLMENMGYRLSYG